MKTATVRELRNGFARISKWIDKGETVQVVKRGKPYARVVPEPGLKSFFGAGAGAVQLPADIDEPVAVKWAAMQ